MRDYQLISPSLDGILHHESVVYDGIVRPTDILRFRDRPYTEQEQKVISQYFSDLSAVFLKKFAAFAADVECDNDAALKLQAVLQEMIKIKKLLAKIAGN